LEDHSFVVLKLAQKGHSGCSTDCFFGQMVFVVAGLRPLGRTAAAPLVGPSGAHASVAGPFLAEEFLGRTGDLAAAQGRVGAGTSVGFIHQNNFVQQLAIDLAAEIGGIDLDDTDFFALAIKHVECDWPAGFCLVLTLHLHVRYSRLIPEYPVYLALA
jgi:hypothetical protein